MKLNSGCTKFELAVVTLLLEKKKSVYCEYSSRRHANRVGALKIDTVNSLFSVFGKGKFFI